MASASAAIRMALSKINRKGNFLIESWNKSQSAVYNKFMRNNWTAKELASVAELTGGRLAFVYPDGQQIYIDAVEENED